MFIIYPDVNRQNKDNESLDRSLDNALYLTAKFYFSNALVCHKVFCAKFSLKIFRKRYNSSDQTLMKYFLTL